MILKGKKIRHINNMDVAYKIYYQLELEDCYKLEGFVINMAYIKSFVIMPLKFHLDKSDLHNWLYCLEPDKECIRYSKWEPVQVVAKTN